MVLGKTAYSSNCLNLISDSRCSYVRPPIIVSDVSRPHPVTVKWSSYAQSVTKKPMKGMLTGPVTILNWSFPRADISRDLQCKQLALALRDEVIDLEKAGIKAVQVDEPALREGVSNHHVPSFRLCSSSNVVATPQGRLGCLPRLGSPVIQTRHCWCHRRPADSLSLLLLRLR